MRLKPLCISEEGSTLVLTSLGMLVIIAFVGLAIDVGNLRFAKRHLQAAADAAALAAALEVYSCQGTNACSAMQTAAQSSLTENGFSASTILSNCSGTAGSGLTITINNPPCAQGSNDPNNGNTGYVEVIASEKQPTYFASLVGFKNPTIAVRAEAKKTPNKDCVYSLDSTGAFAMTANIVTFVNSSCGIVDESNNAWAFGSNIIASFTAPEISVAGGSECLLCLFPSSGVTTGVTPPVPANPLANLPTPSIPACGTGSGSTYHGSSSPLVLTLGSYTLYPDGAYCGGISILGANVTFEPGTYVIESQGTPSLLNLFNPPGGLTISVLANVTGTGVTFYNYGPYGAISMVAPSVTLGNVNLVAPTSGTYACMLFFQDPGNTSTATIIGSSSTNTVLQGIYYFPTAVVDYAAALNVSYNALIAKDIVFGVLSFPTSSFSSDYSSVPNGCPLSGGGSVLVQ
jgi:Flp pilus assembly protein TadG